MIIRNPNKKNILQQSESSNILVLEDDSLMPFGKYKGMPMMRVPVEWLHWFWESARKNPNNNAEAKAVINYIYESLYALREENEDLIWSRP